MTVPPQPPPRAAGEPAEIAHLSASVRRLLHAVDAVRDQWAEADGPRRQELWRKIHTAADAIWSADPLDAGRPTNHYARERIIARAIEVVASAPADQLAEHWGGRDGTIPVSGRALIELLRTCETVYPGAQAAVREVIERTAAAGDGGRV